MGCGCGKPKPPPPSAPREHEYALIVGNRVQTFGSRLEAEAEYVRAGRQGRVTQSF